MHRTNRVGLDRLGLACALVVAAAGCTAPGGTPGGTVAPATATGAFLGPFAEDGTPNASRDLGTFATMDEANAAARAAKPAPGSYVSATVEGRIYVFDSTGTAFSRAPVSGSGAGQRPPKNPGGD